MRMWLKWMDLLRGLFASDAVVGVGLWTFRPRKGQPGRVHGISSLLLWMKLNDIKLTCRCNVDSQAFTVLIKLLHSPRSDASQSRRPSPNGYTWVRGDSCFHQANSPFLCSFCSLPVSMAYMFQFDIADGSVQRLSAWVRVPVRGVCAHLLFA